MAILRETLGADASFTKQMAGECSALGSARPTRIAAGR
jgi:hypothetical protein